MESPKRVLIARTDRIGDVILSLPAATALKRVFPSATVDFLVQSAVIPILEIAPHVDGTVAVDGYYHRGVLDATLLAQKLKRRQYDLAITLFPRPQIARALKKARIRIRVGTSRRWYSYRFNRRVPVRRAGSGCHESELNLRLLNAIDISTDSGEPPQLTPTAEDHSRVATLLQTVRLDDSDRASLVAIHPGCGGSAANWPLERYVELSQRIAERGLVPLWTGSTQEGGSLRELLTTCEPNTINLAGLTDLRTLAALYQQCRCVVAPSTGPLHLAAAVGTPVVGLYGPIVNTEPARWGPLGEKNQILTPDVPPCKCRVGNCRLGNCMERITVESVFESLVTTVEQNPAKENPRVSQSAEVRVVYGHRHAR